MLRRFSVFSLVFLLCLSLFPARAFAWDVIPKGVLYQGDVEGSNYGAVVAAYNQFDAACYVLGKDPNTISASIKEKLSDANYGGKFYEYSQSFFTQSGALEDIPGWVPTYVVMISELGDLMLSDYQSVWYSSTTKALHDAALVDFKRVLLGEDLSGGSETPSLGTTFEMRPNYRDASKNWTGFKGTDGVLHTNQVRAIGSSGYSLLPDTFAFVVPDTYFSSYGDSVVSDYDFVFRLNGMSKSAATYGSVDCNVYAFRKGAYSVDSASLSYNGVSYTYVNAITTSESYLSSSSFTLNYTLDGNTFVVSNAHGPALSSSAAGTLNIRYCCCLSFTSSSAPAVPPPSGTWPEPATPAAPVAPELPEPAEPVVETPVSPSVSAPSWPDVTINIDVDPTPGTTPSGLDYTELLTRINDNLISIDSFVRAINSNLNSLRSDLLAEFNGVYDSLRNIYSYLLTIDTVLETHCVHLRNKMEESAVFIANYMRTLIKWLADQLDYDDLTNVEAPDNSLLTTINEKLGGGTYEPNPIKDESAYYEWLDDLWDRFLLGDNWQSSIGNISGSFSELKTRFPFSVPWDIVALFRLFVHDPVTPVFDLPLYFSADGSTPVHVDLSPWDSVASLVRPMVFVIFALKLALLSRDLLGGLGADKGGL